MSNGWTPPDMSSFNTGRTTDRSPLASGSLSNRPFHSPHTPTSPSPSRFQPQNLPPIHDPSARPTPNRNHSLTHTHLISPHSNMAKLPLRREPSLTGNEQAQDTGKIALNGSSGWSFSGVGGAAAQPLTPLTDSPPQRLIGSPFGSGPGTTRPRSSSSEASRGLGSATRMDSLGKRRRDLEADSGLGSASKRPTPDPTGPMNAPAMSRESSHGGNSVLRDIFGSDFDEDMQQMQRDHAQAEEQLRQEQAQRLQQEQADEELARRLHEEMNGSSVSDIPPRPPPSTGLSTQSVLGTNGRFRRPSPPPPTPPLLAPAPVRNPPQPAYGAPRQGPSSTSAPQNNSNYVNLDSDDDDIQILDVKPVSHGFGQPSRTLPWPASNGHSGNLSHRTEAVDLTRGTHNGLSNGLSGSQISRNNTLNGFNPNGASSMMGNTRLPGIGSMGGYQGAVGSSVYGSTMNRLQGGANRMPGAFDLDDDDDLRNPALSFLNAQVANYPTVAPGFANGSRNSAFGPGGMSSFGDPYSAVLPGAFPASIQTRMPWGPDDDNSVSHPWEHDEADPFDWRSSWNEVDNSEALKDLLSNIRPDEDVNLGSDDRDGTPEGMADTANLYKYQQRGLAWLSKMEEGSNKGSILADDMGLGKTIQAIALMVSRRSTDDNRKTNLIIAPVALIRQWESEIATKVRPSHKLTTFIYHGSNPGMKKATFKDLSKYDVVITTFGSLMSDHRKYLMVQKRMKDNENYRPEPSDTPVLVGNNCRWYRVILDEAQNIKNRTAKTSVAAHQLLSIYRLCMTGTPMMNSIDELFSLIHFLRIKPYSAWEKFNADFARPLKKGNPSGVQRAMQRVQALCKAIMLRRNKKSTFEGKPLITLPERTVDAIHAEFDDDQAKFYQAIETQSQLQFNKFLKAGTVGRNYSNVLTLLLRLRQAACHPHLIKDYAIALNADPEDLFRVAKDLPQAVVARLIESGIVDCPVCMDAARNYTIFHPCGHSTCSECYCRLVDSASTQAAANDGDNSGKTFTCHSCRATIDSKQITDYDNFKMIHMPELAAEEGIGGANAADEDDDDDSDSDSDSDETEDEDGDDSDLKDFVVKDDDEDALKEEASDDEDADDLDEVKPARSVKSRGTKSKPSNKVKPEDKAEDFDDDYEEDQPGYTKGSNPFERANGKKLKKKKKKAKGKAKEKTKGRKTLAELKKEAMRSKPARKAYMRRLAKDFIPSAKTAKCINLLEEIQNAPEGEKTIVFSQFTSLLDLVEIPINQKGWRYTRFDGSMNAGERNNAVQLFTKDPRYKIMLVSLKAGNAGLNLTAASQVIMLDPFWNPYIEEQAIDRAHRIGQKRPVKVQRVLVSETVEDRIIALQEKKRQLIEGALDEGAGQAVGRLGTRELAFLFGVRS